MIKSFLKKYLKKYKIYKYLTIGKFKWNRINKIPKKLIFLFKKNKSIIDKLLLNYPMIDSAMISKNQLRIILTNLKKVIDSNVEGDVVELGCFYGTTSLYIKKILDYYKSNKIFHVYDSFEGLPEKGTEDINEVEKQFEKGYCKTNKETFINNFKSANFKLPEIHVGWFGEIPDNEYPTKIAFAFFDGDFYNSIYNSFEKVYPKLVSNGRIAIDDYQWAVLPGVERACKDFLKDKPEKGTITNEDKIGILIKK